MIVRARFTASVAAGRSPAAAAARALFRKAISSSTRLASWNRATCSSAARSRALTRPGSRPESAPSALCTNLVALPTMSRSSTGPAAARAVAGPRAAQAASPRSSSGPRRARLSVPQLAQSPVIDSEVVGDLVQDGGPHLPADLRLASRNCLEVGLVDGDLVGENHAVARVARREGLPLVQPEQ